MASHHAQAFGRLDGAATLGFGTAPLGASDADEAIPAPRYGAGAAEARLGRALRGLDRKTYSVSTKVGWLIPADDPDETAAVSDPRPAFSRDAIRRSLEGSLERLGLDYVDLVLVHDPDDHLAEAIDDALPLLNELKDEGVVGTVGVGTTRVWPAVFMIKECGLDACLIAGRYSLLDQEAAQDLLPLCGSRDVTTIVGGVFNSGILASDDLGGTFDYGAPTSEIRQRASALSSFASAHGVPLAALALQFPTRNTAVSCVLAGMKNVGEVEANVALFGTAIDDALWREIDESGLLESSVAT
jgi:D-threo-aldose 1-dehydrogenase